MFKIVQFVSPKGGTCIECSGMSEDMELQSAWEQIGQAVIAMSWLEATAVLAGLAYVVLAARENIWCWLFGGLNGLLSVILFAQSKLYAESGLYVYYILAAAYGWYSWRAGGPARAALHIRRWSWRRHLRWIVLALALSALLGWALHRYTDAEYPWVDAPTTLFSFLATYLVTRKVLENWWYWIVIDAASVGLYSLRELYLYALLMAAYTVIAVGGWLEWRKHYRLQAI